MTDVLDILNKLPPVAWMVLPGDPLQVIAVKRGVMGYYPVRRKDSANAAREFADKMNVRHGVTLPQREAMEVGSHFGWEVPGADPDSYELTLKVREPGATP